MSVASATIPATVGRPVRAPAVPNAVLGMAIFLLTEVMFFCGLISAYVVLRGQVGVWPPPGQPRLPIWGAAVAGALLLTSGLTVRTSFRATALLGATFLAIQGAEWIALLSHGLTSSSSLYAALFHVVVGSHALHVAAALVAVMWATMTQAPPASSCGRSVRMLWTFVVAIWPPLYGVIYLW